MLYLLDFKSEPDIPYSQGSFTFDDNPQCTLSYSLKEDEVTLSATGILLCFSQFLDECYYGAMVFSVMNLKYY